MFNATAAFLSFVSAAIIPNRRSKGRDATSSIAPHVHFMRLSQPRMNLFFIDDIRFSTFACKLHTPCKGSRSFLGLQPVLEPLAKLQYRRYKWDSSPKGHCILYTLPFICDVDSLLPSRFGAIATAAPCFALADAVSDPRKNTRFCVNPTRFSLFFERGRGWGKEVFC